MVYWQPVSVAMQSTTYINYLAIVTCTMTALLAINLHFYSLSKFGGFGTFEQLKQGQETEKLHAVTGSKLLKKCFHIDILTVCS